MLRLLQTLGATLVIATVAFALAGDRAGAPARDPLLASFPGGDENSVVVAQNLGTSASLVEAAYHDDDGSVVAQEPGRELERGQSTTFYQAANSALPHGFRGSAIVTADQRVETLHIKNIRDGSQLSLGVSNGTSLGFEFLSLPIIYKQYGDWNSRFTIQNTSDFLACVRMTYVDGVGNVATAPAETLAGCPQGGFPLAATGVMTVEPAQMPVPEGFIGAVRIDSRPNSEGLKARLTGDADVWGAGRRFASYRAAALAVASSLGPDDDVGLAVFVPLVMKRAGAGNAWYTAMHIHNVFPNEGAATVTITYYGPGLPPEGAAKTVKVASFLDVYHNAELDDFLPPGFIGRAVVTADKKIAVAVARGKLGTDIYSAYTGIAEQATSSQWYLPLIYRHYSATANQGWNSWFRVQVVDGGQAKVTVTLIAQANDIYDCPVTTTSATFTVDGQRTFQQAAGEGWPQGLAPSCFVGSAVLASDRPIAVIGNVVASSAYAGDVEGTYNAFSLAGSGPFLGDGDCDGLITIVDALLIAQHVVGLAPALPCSQRADFDQDGSVQITDALLVAQKVVGLI